jgi:hypothetical protein
MSNAKADRKARRRVAVIVIAGAAVAAGLAELFVGGGIANLADAIWTFSSISLQ